MAITAFRVLWFAQLGSNIGTWMQTVGAQWYLVEAAAGAMVTALVQTASLAPAMLFSLPAGVLADSLDRRKLLIWGSAASARSPHPQRSAVSRSTGPARLGLPLPA